MRTMKCCIDKAEVNHSGKDRFIFILCNHIYGIFVQDFQIK